MFTNYLKTALRNLWKNKGYSFINIFGLAVGMAVTLLIGIWVRHQMSFNDFHVNKKHIARLMKRTMFNDHKGTQTGVMLPLYDELKMNYPEVKQITRMDWGGAHSLIAGDKKLSSNGHFVDPGFLRMFSFPLVKGNPQQALNQTYSIVLTESLAKSLFGDENPLGKMVTMDNKHPLMVSGVAKDVPANSTIRFEYLIPYELEVATNNFVKNSKTQWGNNFLQNFVELNEGVTPQQFSKRIENIVREKMDDPKESTLFVHPMSKWHLYSEFKDWVNTGGAIAYVRLFAIIGILVLVIACINFMNLSTARSGKRAREVGIRKAMGSQRTQLVAQFLGESMVTAVFAFLIAVLLVKLCLPLLTNVGFEHISFNLANIQLVLYALAGCLLTGLLAGCYPALYLSGFTAVKVLKGTFQPGKSASVPRKLLVIIQFSFSIALIIGTIIVFQQIQYAKSRPLGYDPNNLILFNISEDLQKKYEPLKQDLLATGFVEAVSKSSSPMTGIYNQWDNFSWAGKAPDSRLLFSAIMVDFDYDKTSGLKIKEGRFFSRDFATDTNAAIINEAALKMIGFEKPVGSTIKMGEENLTVIGVSENIVMQDPFSPVQPAIMILRDYFVTQGFVRFRENADLSSALAAIKPVFEKYNPAYPFDYRFTDEEFARKFRNENQIGRLAGIFAVLSILISCLGLFGLASFMAERRTKEIGIRKVLGASVTQAWVLLSKEFVVLVLISCVIASPIAIYFLSDWLKQYEYRIAIGAGVIILSALAALIITIATVSFQAIKAAVSNPVNSLRSE